jgi:hypothetical protein
MANLICEQAQKADVQENAGAAMPFQPAGRPGRETPFRPEHGPFPFSVHRTGKVA